MPKHGPEGMSQFPSLPPEGDEEGVINVGRPIKKDEPSKGEGEEGLYVGDVMNFESASLEIKGLKDRTEAFFVNKRDHILMLLDHYKNTTGLKAELETVRGTINTHHRESLDMFRKLGDDVQNSQKVAKALLQSEHSPQESEVLRNFFDRAFETLRERLTNAEVEAEKYMNTVNEQLMTIIMAQLEGKKPKRADDTAAG